MMHCPILIKKISLSFFPKTCFEDFNTQINYGSRIAIMGNNGSGKSSLLKIIKGEIQATDGKIEIPNNVIIGYVPQVIDEFDSFSGGQRFNKALTKALGIHPNLLILDEPTNHLDLYNRTALIRMVNSFKGTLIIASHDVELLRNCVENFWHIEEGKIHLFNGNYDDYVNEILIKRGTIEAKTALLNRLKRDSHQLLMREQSRAAKSRRKGQKNIKQNKWPTIVSNTKALRGEETAGRKKYDINIKKEVVSQKLADLRVPEIIKPKFSLNVKNLVRENLITVAKGMISYGDNLVLNSITMSVNSNDRIAIMGNNGSGKSTLIKAILCDKNLIKAGDWYSLKKEDIGYLDQHYSTLNETQTVFENIR